MLAASGLFALFAVCAGYVGPCPSQTCAQSGTGEGLHSSRRSRGKGHVDTPNVAGASSVPLIRKLTSDMSISATKSPHSQIDYTLTASFLESILLEACLLLRRCCPYQQLPLNPPEPIIRVSFFEGCFPTPSFDIAHNTLVL